LKLSKVVAVVGGDVLAGAVLYYGRPLAFEALKRLKDVLGTPCVKVDIHSFRNFSSLQSELREQAKVLIRIDIQKRRQKRVAEHEPFMVHCTR
jgi:hypothetical protein